MSNDITGKYFEDHDFLERADQALEEACHETGFRAEYEIFRGYIYDKKKVGSLIFLGRLRGRAAVLKLQGLKLEIDEVAIFQAFTAQNQSKRIRVPRVYAHRAWTKKRGYGYLLMESIEAPEIFRMPWASPEEIADFCRFYQEYRTKSVNEPWIPAPAESALDFTLERVTKWRRICEHKQRLAPSDYLELCAEFSRLAERYLHREKLVFCHGHLTADDIHRNSRGYVLTSNLFWGWRLPWYDLAFNLWACNLHLRLGEAKLHSTLDYLYEWRTAYSSTPVVKADPDFARRFDFVMLERTLSAILADLGTNDDFDPLNGIHRHSFRALLKLHQQLFEHFAGKLA